MVEEIESDWKILESRTYKLHSGYNMDIQLKENVTNGKKGINLNNKRFFFPIAIEDAKDVCEALGDFFNKMIKVD